MRSNSIHSKHILLAKSVNLLLKLISWSENHAKVFLKGKKVQEKVIAYTQVSPLTLPPTAGEL